MTKTEYENLFVRSAFIALVWDRTNKDAPKLMKHCRQELPADWCARAAREIGNVRLRHQWFASQLHGEKAPRVLAAVHRHYEREFQKTYPKGLVTFETTSEKALFHAGDFDQEGQTHSQVCMGAF